MNVLALDGAFGAFSAAVAVDGAIVATKCESGSVALERGLPIVDAVLAAAKLRGERIDRLAVGVGPGSFTGLRIAIAYAKALAAVWQRPSFRSIRSICSNLAAASTVCSASSSGVPA